MFPSTFPIVAATTLVKYVKGEEKELGKLAAAAYEMVGYGLYLKFGDVRIQLTNEEPAPTDDDMVKMLGTMTLDDPEQLKKMPPWLIALLIKLAVRILT